MLESWTIRCILPINFKNLNSGHGLSSHPKFCQSTIFFFHSLFQHWWFSCDPRRPLSLYCEWCIGNHCALNVPWGLPFAPRPSVSPATPQVGPQAPLGISRFSTCSGMRFTSESSCLDPYILSVIFLDFAPFWVTPMWTTCLAFEFPWLLGYISQIMHSLWLIDQFFLFFPLYFVQALFIWDQLS